MVSPPVHMVCVDLDLASALESMRCMQQRASAARMCPWVAIEEIDVYRVRIFCPSQAGRITVRAWLIADGVWCW